ncbi:MAG: hypothetical protein DMF63_08615 [Acidobacteria bacterium]|nr:MAG: hypothetical protein DMF63_08615 [Acidobacteriota bacterium]
MKYAFLLLLLTFSPLAQAQPPKSKVAPAAVKKSAAKTNQTAGTTKPKPKPGPPLSEKEQFDKASAHELAADRVKALEKFLTNFPRSEHRAEATDLLMSSRVLIAEEKILSGDADGAVSLIKRVIADAPQPMTTELFESISRIPSSLFFRGQRPAAIDLANTIESKVEGNAAQLLEIANFHLATENGSEAMRVAVKAAVKDPSSPAVHRTLALAHRINFDLDLSADEYAKSLELEPGSVVSKRGLAEMKRALGKSDEAVALYRELVAKNENDLPSRTGLILALFDAGSRTEAEAELARSLEKTPGNMILLAGAAYWYASKGFGDKAVELAEKAVAKEPRYVWSHIALARGLIAQGRPVEAEQTLIKARAYGNFPTLEYELASARMTAGFFREAVEDLQKQFQVTSTGNVKTNLGGRVVREEKSLADLASFERKASIFSPAADDQEQAETLKSLLAFDQKLQSPAQNEAEIVAAAEAFAKGSDKMRLHRQIYAASLLLQKRIAIPKVVELAKAATASSDTALEVANPRSAVMASELYEPRAAAFRKGEFLLVPEVPNQTLLAILRGRIEEIAGWALYQQNNFSDAVVRLRRAKSVLPEKSAWWRSSVWRLGAALAAEGKDVEALNLYIESYKADKPDLGKYTIVEALYRKVNGNIDGLEEKLGREHVSAASAVVEPTPAPIQTLSTPAADAPATTAPPLGSLATEILKPIESKSDPEVKPTVVNEIPKAVEPNIETPVVEKPKLVEKKSDPEVKPSPVVETPKPAETKVETPVEDKPKPVETKAEPEAKPSPVSEEKAKPVESKPEPEVKPSPVDELPKAVELKADATPDPIVEEKSKEVETKTEPVVESPKTDEVKTEPAAETKPTLSETPTTGKVGEKSRSETVAKSSEKKPLFEPIIIKIPAPKPATKSATELSGSARPRLIDNQEVKAEAPETCGVSVSQESISLINGGGTVGLLVTVETPGDIKDLVATSSSPKDVDVAVEPEISGVADRRFFVIKSRSSLLGIYTITFAVPCGKKDVVVTVR